MGTLIGPSIFGGNKKMIHKANIYPQHRFHSKLWEAPRVGQIACGADRYWRGGRKGLSRPDEFYHEKCRTWDQQKMGMLEPHRTRMNGYIFYMEIPVNWIVSGGVLLQLQSKAPRQICSGIGKLWGPVGAAKSQGRWQIMRTGIETCTKNEDFDDPEMGAWIPTINFLAGKTINHCVPTWR